MNLAVIGGETPIGRALIRQARARDMTVRALVPDANVVTDLVAPGVTLIAGDPLDLADLTATISRQDAVLLALSPSPYWLRRSTRMQRVAQMVIDTMRAQTVRRLIALSSVYTYKAANPNQNWLHNRLLRPLLWRARYDDLHGYEGLIRYAQGIDWTLVRVPRVLPGEKRGNYRATELAHFLPVGVEISAEDVAFFMLEQLHSTRYVREAVTIAY